MMKHIKFNSIIPSPRRFLPGLLFVCGFAVSLAAFARDVPYQWRSVRIGGGGYVSGLVFHPAVKGLYYARTDVGGAYRWDDKAAQWIPLTDWIDADDENLAGIDSIALDPNDSGRVYLAAGTYTTDRAGAAAILSSRDRGGQFQRIDLPFKLGANELGRGNGERLAVDPHDGRRLFLGSRTAGLWRSDDHAAHWSHVAGFPALATSLASTAENHWRRQSIGIVFVVFEPASGQPGEPTPELYAGVSTRQTSLYRSTDGGIHWSAVPGQPVGLRPNHMTRSPDGSYYLTYGDEPGPDEMHDGAVWKFTPADGRWTDITPIPRHDGPSGFGWGDIAVDAHDPKILMATTFCHYTPYDEIYRSTDGGIHWRAVFPHSSFDHSNAAWTRDHHPHWMSDIAIDPFDPDHVMFVTGYGIWASRNMRALDHGGTVDWWFQDTNLEETVPLDLASPSRGAHLLSAVGDLDGFRHDDLDHAPLQFDAPPRYSNGESIDIAGMKPQVVVRAGRLREVSPQVRAAYSLDGGSHWKAFATAPTASAEAGSIAISADGTTVAWHPAKADTIFITRDWGAHWQRSGRFDEDAQILADRIDPASFYLWEPARGVVLRSTDGGAHFAAVAGDFAKALVRFRSKQSRMKAVPGRTGELWLASESGGVIHGRADGQLLVTGSGFDTAQALGFGKASSGQAGATVFVAGRRHGQRGLFRSLDDGASWERINDDAHQYGGIRVITGDPKVFGRVYVGTSGRGIVMGDPVPETAP